MASIGDRSVLPTPISLYRVGNEQQTYHIKPTELLHTHEMLKCNELFVGVPWQASDGFVSHLGLISHHLRGVDLQHYRAPILTESNNHKITDWSFNPFDPLKFASVSDGIVQFFTLNPESRAAHQVISPDSVFDPTPISINSSNNPSCINNINSIFQFEYNKCLNTMLTSHNNNSVSILDIESCKLIANTGCAEVVMPSQLRLTAQRNAPRLQKFRLVKSVWNSDQTTIFSSMSNGQVVFFDPRVLDTVLGRCYFHHKNSSGKPVQVFSSNELGSNYIITCGNYMGCLEMKLWDTRKIAWELDPEKQAMTEPIETIDLGSTSSPAIYLSDEETRNLYVCARGDRILRHFTLNGFDDSALGTSASGTNSPKLSFRDSFTFKTSIRQLSMMPKTKWIHQANEISQILKSDGQTIETLHVMANNDDSNANSYQNLWVEKKPLSSSQGVPKLDLAFPSDSNPTTPRYGSITPRNGYSTPLNTCIQCSINDLTLGIFNLSNPNQSTPVPAQFSGSPETFELKPLITNGEWLEKKPIPERKRMPITPWGDLSSDIAQEFLSPTFSDFKLKLVNGDSYPVHRSILAVRSPFFDNLFQSIGEWGETLLDYSAGVTFDIHPQILESVLFYIYTDTLPLKFMETYADQILSLSRLFSLFQLTRWVTGWHSAISSQGLKSANNYPYHSFYLHQMQLLKSKPKRYYSDMFISISNGPNYANSEYAYQDTNRELNLCSNCLFQASEGTRFYAHRIIASSRNKFIDSILRSGMKETWTREVNLDIMTPHALVVFLNFLYTDQIVAEDPNHIMDLWEAGEAYFMPNLISACEMALRELVDVENCVPLYERVGVSMTYLRTFLANYIASRITVIDSEMRKRLDPALLTDLETNFAPVKSSVDVNKIKLEKLS